MFDFEWDENKADINYKKHDLSFDDAKSVFDDYFALTVNDKLHSDFEYYRLYNFRDVNSIVFYL